MNPIEIAVKEHYQARGLVDYDEQTMDLVELHLEGYDIQNEDLLVSVFEQHGLLTDGFYDYNLILTEVERIIKDICG